MSFAHIAQSAEHFLGKEEVTGSIPVMGSRSSQQGYIVGRTHLRGAFAYNR